MNFKSLEIQEACNLSNEHYKFDYYSAIVPLPQRTHACCTARRKSKKFALYIFLNKNQVWMINNVEDENADHESSIMIIRFAEEL